jgi:hypothetical protein
VSSAIGQALRFTTDVAVVSAALLNWVTQFGQSDSEGHDQEWTEEPNRLQGDARVDLEAPSCVLLGCNPRGIRVLRPTQRIRWSRLVSLRESSALYKNTSSKHPGLNTKKEEVREGGADFCIADDCRLDDIADVQQLRQESIWHAPKKTKQVQATALLG